MVLCCGFCHDTLFVLPSCPTGNFLLVHSQLDVRVVLDILPVQLWKISLGDGNFGPIGFDFRLSRTSSNVFTWCSCSGKYCFHGFALSLYESVRLRVMWWWGDIFYSLGTHELGENFWGEWWPIVCCKTLRVAILWEELCKLSYDCICCLSCHSECKWVLAECICYE